MPIDVSSGLAYIVIGTTITITGLGTYNLIATAGVLTIPDTIVGYPVVAIGVSAFEGPRTDILRVEFPNTLTSIAILAFKNCNALTRVVFSNTILATINDKAFELCPITSLLFPSTLTYIGVGVFNLCTSLTSVILSNTSLTFIGNGAFAYCPFTSVTLPNTLISIDNFAFFNGQFTSITLPKNLLSIGGASFQDCIYLNTITLPKMFVYIGSEAFRNCTSLISINIPASLIHIDQLVFKNCVSLTDINLAHSNVALVGWEAFSNCPITEMIFPSTLRKLGVRIGPGPSGRVFNGCTALNLVTFTGTLDLSDATYSFDVDTFLGAPVSCLITTTTDVTLWPNYNAGLGGSTYFTGRLVVQGAPPPPIAPTPQSFSVTSTVSNLVAIPIAGAILKWYSTASGGTPLASSAIVRTAYYYVSQTLNGVESERAFVSVVNSCNAPISKNITYGQTGNLPASCGSGVLQNPNAQLTGKLRSRLLTTVVTYSDAILKGQIRFPSNTAYLQFKKGQLLAAGTKSVRPEQSILITSLQQFGCCQKATTVDKGGLSKYVPYTQP